MDIWEANHRALRVHNDYRASYWLPLMGLDPKLIQASQFHATWMATNSVFSHQGPRSLFQFTDRIHHFGYRDVVSTESIFMSSYLSTPDEAVRAWIESTAGHRNSVVGPYCHMGLAWADKGQQRYYCCVYAWCVI
jgi:uncharacterized protein YkwD